MGLDTSAQRSNADTWVVIDVHRQEFAVPAHNVREILAMPEITAVPLCDSQDRGVINLRGRILPVIDMRKHFGWQSVPEELADFYRLMNQREEDHRSWLRELEKSVTEGTEFRLSTDPHKCAFGQWYYSYRSESPWIMALLRKFEGPHSQIHALASIVSKLTKAGKSGQARGLIDQKRNGEFQDMVSLFQELKELIRDSVKELAMVITTARGTFAATIDHAVAVEIIPSRLIKEVQTDILLPWCGHVRMAERASSLAMVLEPDLLVSAPPRLRLN